MRHLTNNFAYKNNSCNLAYKTPFSLAVAKLFREGKVSNNL
ncbi:hypothetical protein CWATWH0401_1481 [Crocosphaera watsonii WH 0401]|uniref:Uncharacterized protein n=1 Tax=Crocosphaera watsonii WH 0401 TaxID=555881 RepID=T2J806_CROWT|nr:hypothetical protein CWATWH0401_1481 [Crocosphaera watsonii WH 0401]